jgi:hypothetical protein
LKSSKALNKNYLENARLGKIKIDYYFVS